MPFVLVWNLLRKCWKKYLHFICFGETLKCWIKTGIILLSLYYLVGYSRKNVELASKLNYSLLYLKFCTSNISFPSREGINKWRSILAVWLPNASFHRWYKASDFLFCLPKTFFYPFKSQNTFLDMWNDLLLWRCRGKKFTCNDDPSETSQGCRCWQILPFAKRIKMGNKMLKWERIKNNFSKRLLSFSYETSRLFILVSW